MTFHMLDVVRAATVGAAVISTVGLITSCQVRQPALIVTNAAMLALEVGYFVWVTRVRRQDLA